MKYLIDFHHGVTEAQIDAYLDQYGYTFLQEWNNFERVILVESDVEPVKTDLVEYVVRDDHLEISPRMYGDLQFNQYHSLLTVPGLPTVTFSTSDEKDWWKNYVLPDPDFENPTVTISRKGQNVPVYIMDSGFNNSPEFDGVNVTNLWSVTGDDFSDQNGHGTCIASVIAGNTCGITAANIKVVKIFRPDRGTYQSEFISAIDAILNDFPQNSFGVVNCSWIIPRNTYVENKILQMILKGLFVLAAAGNDGTPIEDVTPAAMPEVLTIGSFNSNLEPSKFSNYTGGSLISYTENDVNHGELDGWAPGEKIWVNGAPNSFGYAAGTSMACAISSAVLAFNLTDYLDSQGKRLTGYDNVMLTNYRAFIFRRQDLLDLSDPKYSTSKNFIVTIADISTMVSNISEQTERLVACTVDKGIQILSYAFDVHNTKKVTLLDPLPISFEINQEGVVIGSPTTEQYFSDTSVDYKKIEVRLDVTNLDDEVQNKKLIFFIFSTNFNKDDVEDPEINILLQNNCNAAFAPTCFGVGTSPGCLNNCPGGYFCCGSSLEPKFDSCYCGIFG